MSNVSAMCLEGEPIMNAAHGSQTHVCEVRVLFLRFGLDSSPCTSVFPVRIMWYDCRETHRARASLFQANSSPASGGFAVAGTSKWISPTSPQAIKWIVFFLHFLSRLSDL